MARVSHERCVEMADTVHGVVSSVLNIATAGHCHWYISFFFFFEVEVPGSSESYINIHSSVATGRSLWMLRYAGRLAYLLVSGR